MNLPLFPLPLLPLPLLPIAGRTSSPGRIEHVIRLGCKWRRGRPALPADPPGAMLGTYLRSSAYGCASEFCVAPDH